MRICFAVIVVCLALLPATAWGQRTVCVAYLQAGNRCVSQENLDKAQTYYSLALEEARQSDDANLLLQVLDQQASCLLRLGQTAEAESAWKECLRIAERDEQPDDAVLDHLVGRLVATAYCQGKLLVADALQSYRVAKLHDSREGKEHPSMAAELNNLAVLKLAQEETEAAEETANAAWTLLSESEDAEKHDLANCLDTMAQIKYAQGEHEEAERLVLRALLILKTSDEDHPVQANALRTLGKVSHAKGEYERAAEASRSAVEIHAKALGASHPESQHSRTVHNQLRRELTTANNSPVEETTPVQAEAAAPAKDATATPK